MRQSNKRALTWSLIVIGVVMLVLGGVMLATFPWQQGGLPFAHMWAQGQGATPDGSQGPGIPQGGRGGGPGAWYGYHHGWFMHGPRFFGGGLLILVLVVLAISVFARRFSYRGSWRHDDPDRGLNAEEILRKKFALGDIIRRRVQEPLERCSGSEDSMAWFIAGFVLLRFLGIAFFVLLIARIVAGATEPLSRRTRDPEPAVRRGRDNGRAASKDAGRIAVRLNVTAAPHRGGRTTAVIATSL